MEHLLLIFFSFFMILSAFMVIHAVNPVHSVIALIFVFFNGAGIFFVFGLEYLALVLIVVYVGAVAVLFLFVVMMLNIKKISGVRWKGTAAGMSLIILVILLKKEIFPFYGSILVINKVKDMEIIGQILYTHCWIYVLIAGLALLLAMIGAILLTMVHSLFVKRQDIALQVRRESNLTFKEVFVKGE